MNQKKQLFYIAVSPMIPLLFLLLSSLSFFEVFENKIFDIFMRLKPVHGNSRNILFLEQDDAAIAETGRVPWPRERFAKMLSILREFSPESVIFDIEFLDKQEPVPVNTNGDWHLSDQDAALSDAVKKSGNVYLTFQGRNPPLVFSDISDTFKKISIRETAYWMDMIRQYRMLVESFSLIRIGKIEEQFISDIAGKFSFSGTDSYSLARRRSLGRLLILVQEENILRKDEVIRETLAGFISDGVKQSFRSATSAVLRRIAESVLNGENYRSVSGKCPEISGRFTKKDYEKLADLFDYLYRNSGIWECGSGKRTFIDEVNSVRETVMREWNVHSLIELDKSIRSIDAALMSGEKDSSEINRLWDRAIKLFDRKKAEELLSFAGKNINELNRISLRRAFYDKIRSLDRVIDTSVVIPLQGSIPYGEINSIFFADTVAEPVCDHAKGFGFTNIIYDIDGSVRSVHLLCRYDTFDGRTVILPSLSFSPFLKLCGAGNGDVLIKDNSITVHNRKNKNNGWPEIIKIPLTSEGCFKVNWVNRDWPALFTHLSIAELFRYDSLKGVDVLKRDRENIRNFLKSRISGKTVFVGLTAASTADIGIIPVSNHSPMVAVHANIFNNLQTGNFLKPAGNVFNLILALLLCLPAGFLVNRLKPLKLFGAGISVFLLCFACSFVLMALTGVLLKPLFIGSSVFICYASLTLMRYREIDSERKFIHGAFGQYLSPTVIKQLMDDPDKLTLGGEKRFMTAMFTDLQGFSTISEKLSPDSLVSLLNEYLTEMCDIITAHNGTVDKFEGDAIIAFWGAPLDDPGHAMNACLCGLEMQKKLSLLCVRWEEEGRPDFIYNMKMRIGINSGEIVVGNMGSGRRMDYTIMGDSVNLAARLEGANKFYGTYTMISEFTASLVKDAVRLRSLDRIRVVGKSEPVEIFELLDESLAGKNSGGLEVFKTGLEWYRKKNFSKAKTYFKKALELMPGDGPSLAYIERCTEFLKNPPRKWDGVYTLTAKG